MFFGLLVLALNFAVYLNSKRSVVEVIQFLGVNLDFIDFLQNKRSHSITVIINCFKYIFIKLVFYSILTTGLPEWGSNPNGRNIIILQKVD